MDQKQQNWKQADKSKRWNILRTHWPILLTSHGHEKENVLKCKELGPNSQFQCVVLQRTLYRVSEVNCVI